MTFQVASSFEDGITRFINCGPDETVADASYKAGVNISLDCRDSACGTCRSPCESGRYDGGDYIEETLTDGEAALGYCLLPDHFAERSRAAPPLDLGCRQGHRGDPHGHHDGDRAVLRGMVGCVMDLDDREALGFLPGQYGNVTVPGTPLTRSYSFSSGPK